MNKVLILFTLIIFSSCGSRIFEGRFNHTDVEMHFGPDASDATTPEGISILDISSQLYPDEKNDSSIGCRGNA